MGLQGVCTGISFFLISVQNIDSTYRYMLELPYLPTMSIFVLSRKISITYFI